MENILIRHKEKYAAGSCVSIADFVLASYVRNHLLNPASPVSATLQALLDQENCDTPKFKEYIRGVICTELFPSVIHLNNSSKPLISSCNRKVDKVSNNNSVVNILLPKKESSILDKDFDKRLSELGLDEEGHIAKKSVNELDGATNQAD